MTSKMDSELHPSASASVASTSHSQSEVEEMLIDDIGSSEPSVTCNGCGKLVKSLLRHLGQKKQCQTFYNMVELREEAKEKVKKNKRKYNADKADEIKKYKKKYYAEKAEDRIEYQKKYYAEKAEDRIEYQKKYYAEQAEDRIEYQKNYDAENAEEIKKYKQSHYAEKAEDRIEYQKNYNAENAEEIKKYKQSYYAKNVDKRLQYQRSYSKDIVEREKTFARDCSKESEEKRLRAFQKEIMEGISYVCMCCHRTFFKTGVVSVKVQDLKSKIGDLFTECIHLPLLPAMCKGNDNFLCFTCKGDLYNGKKPCMRYTNGLQVDEIPEELKLNDLESTLVARNILFMKLFNLPKSRWSALRDKVVNVALTDNDFLRSMSVVTSLPRMPSDAGLIAVQLKRKLEYKNKVIESYINPDRIVSALKKLVDLKNRFYDDVAVNENYKSQIEEKQQNDVLILDSEDESDNSDDDRLEEVKNAQHDLNKATFMTDKFPETRVVVNTSDKVIEKSTRRTATVSTAIAPGEGLIPSNLMRDKNWDAKAFPCLFPKGRGGVHDEREQKLSSQKYFVQRLQNVDERFSNCTSFVFACLYFLEKEQIERQISVSYMRGKVVDKKLVNLEDAFSVFDKIPGTPRYWLQKRYEINAKVEQLGPFQFFFTLSCADKRWAENFVSILQQKGLNVSFETREDEDGSFLPEQIYVNGIKLQDYLEHENLHKMIRDNVLTVTRTFDHRVKAFIRQIVRGKGNPMNVNFHHYRVEFQLRGAGHIHGVLWLDLQEIEKDYPGIKDVLMSKLKTQERLTADEMAITSAFVDKFVSCSLKREDVSEIVSEVQEHHHTATCRKKGTNCRFNFPKFPSERTIIAQPLDKDAFTTTKDFEKETTRLQKILASVKEVLLAMEPDEHKKISTADILKQAKVTKDEYYKALSTTKTGLQVVLKREPSEIYINNYNPEWMKAWNANMDIQVCLDFFAITTYITDYYTKDESGMQELLKDAVKQCASKPRTEKMKFLAEAFYSHRQIGEMEAYYRIFPNLHLSESNIKTVFVASGFQKNRSQFMHKVAVGNEEALSSDQHFIEIEGKEGKFVKSTPIHEKYANRPDELENMCLAQFAILYETMGKLAGEKASKKDAKDTSTSGTTSHKLITSSDEDTLFLPQHISLKDGNYMRARKAPAVLRTHKFSRNEDYHEYLYSELLLYKPWRQEAELFEDDFSACLESVTDMDDREENSPEHERQTKIEKTKQKLFPHKNNVEKCRAVLKDLPDTRPEHIGDAIDAENEQQNEDDAIQGMSEDEDNAFRNPGELMSKVPTDSASGNSIFQRINISKMDDEMLPDARQLDEDQRLVLDIVVKYCKAVQKNEACGTQLPPAPLLKVHGGAGSGKSRLINVISTWAEHWLRTYGSNKDPNNPYVVKCAPTGKAAGIIDGLTLHTAFNFKFGNEILSLSDKQSEKMRSTLSDMRILIVDEMSMVKSDLLYQLDRRLKEIKMTSDDFGGVCVILCGDLMQLKPVRANWIFQPPKGFPDENCTLWNLFQAIELTTNHRQGNDKAYANLLNRVRFEEHTEEDNCLLYSRVNDKFPENAVHIYGKKSAVQSHNMEELNKISEAPINFIATHIHPSYRDFKANIANDGTVNNTPFLNELCLKKSARVMLTFNVDVSDKLTNGSTGKVVGFLRKDGTSATEASSVHKVLVEFDEADAGENLRASQSHILKKFGTSTATPIGRTAFEYSLGAAKKNHVGSATVIQFPLTLAWAVTAHKSQGMTIPYPTPLVADIDTVFEGGQAYVMLGRIQNIDQLFLKNYSPQKLIANPRAKEEAEKIKKTAINHLTKPWTSQNENLKISSLNIRSLSKHIFDLKVDPTLLHSHVICVNETHLSEQSDAPDLPGFSNYSANVGRGKGVTVYVRDNLQVDNHQVIKTEKYQIVKLETELVDIVAVYRSSDAQLEDFAKDVITQIHDSRDTVVCGDVNIDFQSNQGNILTQSLKDKGFLQMVSKPTHIKGNILDHCYIRTDISCTTELYHPYYSDHDAILVLLDLNEIDGAN